MSPADSVRTGRREIGTWPQSLCTTSALQGPHNHLEHPPRSIRDVVRPNGWRMTTKGWHEA